MPANLAPNAQERQPTRLGLARGMATGVAFAVSAAVATLLLGRSHAAIAVRRPVLELLAAAGMLLAAGAAVHLLRHWVLPRRRLLAILGRIRKGESPIGELADLDGGLAPLAEPLEAVLRELRAARAQIAELGSEMQQRVAGRTDALERTIGSLRQQATRDGLTGLFNRRMLDAFLPAAIDRAGAGGELCLLMLDVDHFKALNDTLGHQAGDQVLRQVGQLLRSAIREKDAAFRYGGDEFAVVLPGCPLEAGAALAKRISCLGDELGRTLHLPRSPGLSVGVAALSELTEPNAQRLVDRADQSLYKVKAQRREKHGAPVGVAR